MLAYTWLITHLDKEGRTYGDPMIVRSTVFPRRDDISVDQMEACIQEWYDKCLILWYEVDGDKYIWFPTFEDNQKGLNKSREADSIIPAPSEKDIAQFMIKSGVSQEQITVKLSRSKEEVKSKSNVNSKGEEKEKTTAFPSLVDYFHDLSGLTVTDEWDGAATRLIDEGITPSVLERAWQEIRGKKNYKIKGLQSMVNPCLNVKAGPHYSKLKQQDYDRWLMPK
jgi:hypothetical protein